MSLKEWGEFIDSFKNRKDAEEFVDESRRALARMGFVAESNAFSIHPTFDNIVGRQWYHAVYLREDRIRKADDPPTK